MLPILLRYWSQALAALVALLLGAWLASLWYGPTVDRLTTEAAEARAAVAIQNAAVAAAQREGEAARRRTQAALADARRRAAEQARTVDQLRRDLAARTYKDESCEDAAASALQQWRSR